MTHSADHRHVGLWPYIAIAGAVVIFANAFPAVKICIGTLQAAEVPRPALAFVPLRFAPAAVVYLVLIATLLRREALALVREHPWRMAIAGLAVVPGYNILFNWGLEEIQPGVSALIIATAPLQTALLSIPLLGDRVTPRQALGIGVGFAGIFVIIRWGQGHGVTPGMIFGAAVTILAPTMWSLYTILLKPVFARHTPLTVTGVAIVLGTLPVLLLMRGDSVEALLAEPAALWSWAFLSIGATVLAFYLWNVPLRVISPTALAVFVYFIPVVAVTASVLLWRGPDGRPLQPFNGWLVLGGAVVIAGVVLANEAVWRRPLDPRGVQIES